MRRKKKFDLNLDEDFKPDLAYLVKQSEQEFTEYALKIYEQKESEETASQSFKIQDLYNTTVPVEESNKDESANFNDLLEKAFQETMAQAAQIFKNDTE